MEEEAPLYLCAHCDTEFMAPEGAERRCPRCLRLTTIVVATGAHARDVSRRQGLGAKALGITLLALLLSAGAVVLILDRRDEAPAPQNGAICAVAGDCGDSKGLLCVNSVCQCAEGLEWSQRQACEQVRVPTAAGPTTVPDTSTPRRDYGSKTREVKRLREALEAEPCDREKVIDLVDALAEGGAPREGAQSGEDFLERCGEHERLRMAVATAYKRISEWASAASQYTQLLDEEPYHRNAWGLRGRVWETAGKLEAATKDYQQALAIRPGLSDVPLNLAGLLERLGRHCEALSALDQLAANYPKAATQADIVARMRRLHRLGDCGEDYASGRASIRFRRNAKTLAVKVKVNGTTGSFIVDTGASYVAITKRFAAQAGLDPSSGRRFYCSTANGRIQASLVNARSVDVRGARATNVPVAIIDDLGADQDGLLGLSFLSRFEMKMNGPKGRLTLEVRDRGEQ